MGSNTILMISHFWMMISSECKKIRNAWPKKGTNVVGTYIGNVMLCSLALLEYSATF